MGDEDRFLRLEEVLELCGLSRSHLYRLRKRENDRNGSRTDTRQPGSARR